MKVILRRIFTAGLVLFPIAVFAQTSAPRVNVDYTILATPQPVYAPTKGKIEVAEGWSRTFSGKWRTFLTRRFDRDAKGERIHFASAMTLLGKKDGDGARSGVGSGTESTLAAGVLRGSHRHAATVRGRGGPPR